MDILLWAIAAAVSASALLTILLWIVLFLTE